MIRITADVTPLLTPRTGVGVFVGEMLRSLAPRQDVSVTGYAVTWRGRHRLRDAVPDAISIVERAMPARPLHQIWMRTDHPRIDRWIGRCDVVWGTNYVVPPTDAAAIVSIYDLTPMRFPELADRHTRTFPRLIERALRRGAWVHTLSDFVKEEIVEHFGIGSDRVHVVPGGVRSAEGTAAPAQPSARRLGADPYILALGTVEPRKDLPRLVQAFDQLAAQWPDLRLVIAGADGWGAEALSAAIEHSPYRNRIIRLGWIDEADRPALMQDAAVFAYPSVYEGFGFPPLEAMRAGVPVVSTRAGSLPEICRDAASLVPVGDVDALAHALGELLTDQDLRDELVRRGYKNAARFSWDAAASQLAARFMDIPG